MCRNFRPTSRQPDQIFLALQSGRFFEGPRIYLMSEGVLTTLEARTSIISPYRVPWSASEVLDVVRLARRDSVPHGFRRWCCQRATLAKIRVLSS
jgi:hypothetical protein